MKIIKLSACLLMGVAVGIPSCGAFHKQVLVGLETDSTKNVVFTGKEHWCSPLLQRSCSLHFERPKISHLYAEEQKQPDPQAPSTGEELKAVADEIVRIANRIGVLLRSYWGYLKKLKESPEERSNLWRAMKSNFGTLLTATVRNIQVGELGTRGEQWFLAQLAIAGMVLLGVHPIVVELIKWSGGWYIGGGLLLIVGGLLGLRESLTPFPAPSPDNALVTSGAYKIVRHPIYGGLLLLCVGLSINSGHEYGDKMLLTTVLGFVLNYKANLEESLLRQKHPVAYESYASETTCKLIPYFL